MYESQFHLQQRPFAPVPSTENYFPAESVENARSSLVRLVERDEGPGLVVGPVGIGKSMLAQILSDTFRPRSRVVLIRGGRICTRRTLLQVILYELGLSYKNMEEGELRLSMMDHVSSIDFCPNGVALLVDEADALPMALLDELRTMTNIVTGGQTCIRLILFGSSRLEEKFGHPRLESFNQRLAGRFYIEPFNREETIDYITTHFEQCGGDAFEAFTEDALDTVFQATNGIPRLINQLCDHALILALLNGQNTVSDQLINAAWADLQQLPNPAMIGFEKTGVPREIVEYGELGDDLSDAPSAEYGASDDAEDMDDELDGPMTIKLHSGFSKPEFQDHTIRDAHNPFDDEYEEEEIVLDRFMVAQIMSKRADRTVTCDQSELIAQQLSELILDSQDAIDFADVEKLDAESVTSDTMLDDSLTDDLNVTEEAIADSEPTTEEADADLSLQSFDESVTPDFELEPDRMDASEPVVEKHADDSVENLDSEELATEELATEEAYSLEPLHSASERKTTDAEPFVLAEENGESALSSLEAESNEQTSIYNVEKAVESLSLVDAIPFDDQVWLPANKSTDAARMIDEDLGTSIDVDSNHSMIENSRLVAEDLTLTEIKLTTVEISESLVDAKETVDDEGPTRIAFRPKKQPHKFSRLFVRLRKAE